MQTLHLIGHPIQPAEWYDLLDDYTHGLSPEQAAAKH